MAWGVGAQALLTFICDAAAEAGTRPGSTSPVILLYVAVVYDVLALLPKVPSQPSCVVILAAGPCGSRASDALKLFSVVHL